VAGGIADVINIDTSLINNWATRFASLFKEFAIVGARFNVRITSVSSPVGLIFAYIDEQSAAAPTAASLNVAHATIPIVSTDVDSTASLHKVDWVAKSYADLTWDPVPASGLVGYLKLYASAATGTGATTGAQLGVTGSVAVCFRGYA